MEAGGYSLWLGGWAGCSGVGGSQTIVCIFSLSTVLNGVERLSAIRERFGNVSLLRASSGVPCWCEPTWAVGGGEGWGGSCRRGEGNRKRGLCCQGGRGRGWSETGTRSQGFLCFCDHCPRSRLCGRFVGRRVTLWGGRS